MTIGVYGLGRFGGFWAELLAKQMTVKAYTRNPERSTPPGVIRAQEDEVLACDTVFLCVAISSMDRVVSDIAPKLKPGSVLIDTCSVKVHPVTVMLSHVPAGVSIIGTHPMFGPDSAANGVQGLPLVLCPVRQSDEQLAFWHDYFVSTGMQVHTMTPEEHDREAAYTQGVTHLIGRVLDELSLTRSDMGTVGYHKLLSIIQQTCNDPFQLFVDLQRFNPFTAQMREKFESAVHRVFDQIDEG